MTQKPRRGLANPSFSNRDTNSNTAVFTTEMNSAGLMLIKTERVGALPGWGGSLARMLWLERGSAENQSYWALSLFPQLFCNPTRHFFPLNMD